MKPSPERSPRVEAPPLSALILAGGKSSRMGQDKARLAVNGVPMLRRVYDVAIQCTESVFIITPWPERYHEILPASCKWIVEPSSHVSRSSSQGSLPQGPLVGFAHGLKTLQKLGQLTPWVMLLACDLPYLNADLLLKWAEGLAEADVEAIAALPRHPQPLKKSLHPEHDKPTKGHREDTYKENTCIEITNKQWEPLCGFYRASCLSRLEPFILGGGRSFQRWLQNEHVEALEVGDQFPPHSLLNCNTLDDVSY
ncbi:MAG: NTP transferase domain-containing protein [Leptolyngbyaceae bacterium]|nr:NTP transferase domain-containing protein [Leptolyngbyaceae bacterium]